MNSISIYYNSGNSRTRYFYRKWTQSYEWYIRNLDDGRLLLLAGDGGSVYFCPTDTANIYAECNDSTNTSYKNSWDGTSSTVVINGDGTYTNVAQSAGGNDRGKVGAGACFLDMEADGDLDLFVANYIKFSYDRHDPPLTRGIPWYSGPWVYAPETSTQMQRNNGNGTLSDVGRELPLGVFDQPTTVFLQRHF